jgi:hypothetical protein
MPERFAHPSSAPLLRRVVESSKEQPMNSGGHRGVTVVTVVTLVFAPVLKHNHFVWKLIGKSKETHVEQCVPHQPCPFHRREVKITTLPTPPGAPPFTPPKWLGDDDGGDD